MPAAVAEAQGAGVSASLCQSLLPLDTLAVGAKRVISFYHPSVLSPDIRSLTSEMSETCSGCRARFYTMSEPFSGHS